MKIAVVMSTYNGEKYIREQIDSVLGQQGEFQVDLWIRDDGSTDGTLTILAEYAKAGKLQYYTGENLGPSCSFLDLICRCDGYDYYAFADQDDFWMPDKLADAVSALRDQHGLALYCSNADLVDSRLDSLGRPVYKVAPRTDFATLTCAGGLLGCTMVFGEELAEKIRQKEMPREIVLHDFYVAVLCAALGGRICYDPKVHMKYRQHGENVVGVANGLLGTIKSRLSDITTKPKVSIAEQAAQILVLYPEEIPQENKQWLVQVAHYRDSFWNKLQLSVSRRTRYMNQNMGLKLRLSVLFGNR